MNEKIAALTQAVEAFAPKSLAEIEDFRIKMVGKKGEMTALMEEFKSVAPELKREFGQKLNALKNSILAKINEQKELLENQAASAPQIDDMSRPGSAEQLGSRHPISLVKQEIIDIFSRLGYT
ncbi:MAG: phenylalanine--tRNA ligase subunit alpha, partial [Alistipes sp.]|nr:phenylalanine--tRNA ligase subunit alpha [Alistipes sp.]